MYDNTVFFMEVSIFFIQEQEQKTYSPLGEKKAIYQVFPLLLNVTLMDLTK